MNKQLTRVCPICHFTLGEVLHTQRFATQEGFPLPKGYDVVQCEQCGFVFADVNATQKDYDIYYNKFSKYEEPNMASGGGITSWDRERLKETLEDLIQLIPDKKSDILDVGAANGGLIHGLQKFGYENTYALEPSAVCVKFMKREYNIRAFQGSIFDNLESIFYKQKFDVIILSHVMEHIYDLKKALENITKILKIDGQLYVEVPDASRYKDFFVAPFHYFDVEHINHFDKYSLATLFSLYGFSSSFYKRKATPFSEKVSYPAFFHFFGGKISEIKNSISDYVLLSKENDIDKNIEEIINNNQEVIVWGVGSYTKRLLATTNLKKVNIKSFIDKDSGKQGTTINDIKINSPKILKDFKGVIVVCSALFSDEIISEIKLNRYQNKIIVLK